MKTASIIICTIFILLFTECKSPQLSQIRRIVNNSYDGSLLLNPLEFESSRKLMLEKLDDEILSADSIIILELFPDGTGGRYYTAIYNSYNKIVKCYSASKTAGKLISDSLVYRSDYHPILSMVINGQIEEVKYKGKNTTLTPASRIIVNIITKDEKGKFKGEGFITRNFSTIELEDYD